MLSIYSSRYRFASLIQLYNKAITQSNIKHDTIQIQALASLQVLNDQLMSTHSKWKRHSTVLQNTVPQPIINNQSHKTTKKQTKKGLISYFTTRQFATYSTDTLRIPGLYLYGGSGSGKSFLSDMFYDNLAIEQKRRVHFHEFMQTIHAQLFKLQRQKKGFDPLVTVARNTAQKTRLLYLDEFQVTDVADASILKRLFQQLINNQLVLLATSNRHPKDLYKNGHQRQFFIPFIGFLEQHCKVQSLDTKRDYRYQLEVDESVIDTCYFYPINQESQKKLRKLQSLLTGQQNPIFQQKILEPIPGRKIVVPRSHNKVCVYEFSELVEAYMGDSDFRAICKNHKAIIIKNMTQIQRNKRDMANRMIKLFDQAYFRNVKVYINGEVEMEQLVQALPEKQCKNQQDFQMTRCKSRLIQFQTKKYKETVSYVELKELGTIDEEGGKIDKASKKTQSQQSNTKKTQQ